MARKAAKQQQNIELASPEGRRILTAAIVEYFDEWGLDTASQLNLLGMNPSSRNVLAYYRKGERALPNDPDKLTRAGLLVGIRRRLHELYPHNETLRSEWLSRRNQLFDYKTPLAVMGENGLFGLADVLRSLDARMVL